MYEGPKNCINLSVGGSKIPDVNRDMDLFYTGKHDYFNSEHAIDINSMDITKVIICIGTNDILNTRTNVSRLYIPIQNMLRKAKLMFNCKVYLQSVIPIPDQPPGVANEVYMFNKIALKACISEECKYINVFDVFLKCNHFKKFFRVKRDGYLDIHPNREGQIIIARAYISIVRDRFDPQYHFRRY